MITNQLNYLIKDLQQYVERRLEYAKLDVTEKTVRIVSFLITVILLTLIIFPFLLFLTFALAYFIGQLLHSVALGFLIVAGGYLLLAIFLIAVRKPLITKPILKAMVNMIFDTPNRWDKTEDDDEE